ncbi:Ppx/GppA phosphatase family protein [Chlorobium sp. N1]|uniref:Ppx/GppA phosphatase family protein n=1 Tax=Chlorobium sp. N1 TaxID=2491138 RepID=UPI00103DD7CF|nr:Ppx/GppA phosphatase family protein [Chlorobium sp. N1]TCD48807.1 Ppx/GppA family phosphatase [Chlorobium sp. N1]
MPDDAMRVAAIDLGTNSFHMVIVEDSPGKGIVEIDRVKDMICIGRGSISTKMLDDASMHDGIAALKNFLVLAAQHGVELHNVLAFATSAIREAKNQQDFIQRIRDETGLKVKVISGLEEAEFIYYGVRNAVALRDGYDLLFDIGGGSVEFVIANRQGVHLLESRKIGVARMLERFISNDPVTSREVKLLEQFFAAEMVSAVEAAGKIGVDRAIASSGTAENIARMIRSMQGGEGEGSLNSSSFTRSEFEELYGKVMPLGSLERRKMTGLDEKRVDLIVPGLILVNMIFRLFKLEEIVVSDSSLREGMVLHYLQQCSLGSPRRCPDPELDIRRESVRELGFRCGWNREHSEQVARLSLQLFDELASLHGLDGHYRELLEYSALLHNIGTFISISSHHKHSQYIILNGELRGFSPSETAVIANVARYHRKSPPSEKHASYASLKAKHRRAIDVLSGILRIANGLERGHRQNVERIEVRDEGERLLLCLTTHSDPDIEIWAAEQLKSWLETVLGRTIRFERA